MCLAAIHNVFDPPSSGAITWWQKHLAGIFGPQKFYAGYKVIRMYADCWRPILYNDHLYPYNEWVESEDGNLVHYPRNHSTALYPNGFHFFLHKKDAIRYYHDVHHLGDNNRLVSIRYTDLVAHGEQHGLNCLVARKIYVQCSV